MSVRIDLMKRGYLAENLPPLFSSQSFDKIDGVAEFNGYLIKSPKDPFEQAHYNSSKRGYQRRKFGIPNPVVALDLCNFVDVNWSSIHSFFEASPFSFSKPKPSQSGGRSMEMPTHRDLGHKRFTQLCSSRFILKTDTSRFYPSIYTHSLPWAFHSKEESKKDRNFDSSKVFFNRADFLLRQSQDGQTVGIPVGPDFSRVFGEVISCAIDQKFFEKYGKKKLKAVRYVDDMWIGCKSREEANYLLHGYRDCLREFELDINELKTSVVEATTSTFDFWPIELSREISGSFGVTSKADNETRIYALEKAIDLARITSDDAIVKFVIRKLDALHAWKRHWDILEPFLMKCAVNFPHAVDYVARVLAWKCRLGTEYSRTSWISLIKEIVVYHADMGNNSEVCWALWLLREFKTKISWQEIKQIPSRCGSLPLALVLLLNEEKLITGSIQTDVIYDRMASKGMFGSFWFVAHEAKIRGWFPKSQLDKLNVHDVQKRIIKRGIGFLNPTATPQVFADIDEDHWEDDVESAIEDIYDSYEDDSSDDDTNDIDLPF